MELHCDWVPESWLNRVKKLKLTNFVKNHGDRPPLALEDAIDLSNYTVEKVLDLQFKTAKKEKAFWLKKSLKSILPEEITDLCDSLENVYVKWEGLPYEHSTWESLNAGMDQCEDPFKKKVEKQIASSLRDALKTFCLRRHIGQQYAAKVNSSRVKADSSESRPVFKEIVSQPDFVTGGELKAHQMDGLKGSKVERDMIRANEIFFKPPTGNHVSKVVQFHVLLMSYETVLSDSSLFKGIDFEGLICDEGHRLKNDAGIINSATILSVKAELFVPVSLTKYQKELYLRVLQKNGTLLRATDSGTITEGKAVPLHNVLMELRKVCDHPYLMQSLDTSGMPAKEYQSALISTSGKFKLLEPLLKKLKDRGHRVLIFNIQAMARVHRIGQKRPVLIFKLFTRQTVEERIVEIGKKKLVLDHLVVERMADKEVDKRDLADIIKFGAQKLFEEDESDAIRYDDADLEKLLDREQMVAEQMSINNSTENFEDKAASVKNFAFARVWTLEKEEELPSADKTLPQKRKRKPVNYNVNFKKRRAGSDDESIGSMKEVDEGDDPLYNDSGTASSGSDHFLSAAEDALDLNNDTASKKVKKKRARAEPAGEPAKRIHLKVAAPVTVGFKVGNNLGDKLCLRMYRNNMDLLPA
ncbi:hypothetical protein HDU96_002655 [Phlyctochytrium bullatum]|nr:hypothetical protein HDU96_002655 [Phlyctochytrium bullatum]